ncbi:MAG: carbon-nitrogen hydrolase family protein [Anaerolineae bacterium]
MTYAKVHTCDWDKEALLTPGDAFHVCSLDTRRGAVQVGAMICFDREFPESARILMLKGAELILTPNACRLEANRLGQFRARAYENMLGLAMTNYAAPQENGHSVAFDGIAFDEEGESRDTCLVEAGEEEGVYIATFDLEAIRAYRQREVWGNAYRKPGRYEDLVAPHVAPPFVREDARRNARN